MKKQILVMAMLALLPISAAHAQIGDVSGHIYSTDIAAYIDGMAIPSYNIGAKPQLLRAIWRITALNAAGMRRRGRHI